MKLKLINALTTGRHVVASPAIVSGTGLGELCHVAIKPGEWISLTDSLMKEDFTGAMRARRNLLLKEVADNDNNAKKIVETIDSYNPEL